MIGQREFDAVVVTYEKHGWVLRQVVLADKVADRTELSSDVVCRTGVIDAAWFSRPPQPGPIAWEIRYLGSTQYALVEHLDENSTDFDQLLNQTEQRLADAINAKRTA